VLVDDNVVMAGLDTAMLLTTLGATFWVGMAGDGAEVEAEVKTGTAELTTLMEGEDCKADDVAGIAAGTEDVWMDERDAAVELPIGPVGSAANCEAAFGIVSH
jgi:hypothetical protein